MFWILGTKWSWKKYDNSSPYGFLKRKNLQYFKQDCTPLFSHEEMREICSHAVQAGMENKLEKAPLPFTEYNEHDRSYRTVEKAYAKGILNRLHTIWLILLYNSFWLKRAAAIVSKAGAVEMILGCRAYEMTEHYILLSEKAQGRFGAAVQGQGLQPYHCLSDQNPWN